MEATECGVASLAMILAHYKLKSRRKKFFPLIIHWEFNHFVVLEGFKSDKFFLNDPALGKRQIPLEEFLTSYTGVCLRIIQKENFKPAGRRYNIFKSVAAKLYEDKYAALFAMILGFKFFWTEF